MFKLERFQLEITKPKPGECTSRRTTTLTTHIRWSSQRTAGGDGAGNKEMHTGWTRTSENRGAVLVFPDGYSDNSKDGNW
jgi:hypothetical protein